MCCGEAKCGKSPWDDGSRPLTPPKVREARTWGVEKVWQSWWSEWFANQDALCSNPVAVLLITCLSIPLLESSICSCALSKCHKMSRVFIGCCRELSQVVINQIMAKSKLVPILKSAQIWLRLEDQHKLMLMWRIAPHQVKSAKARSERGIGVRNHEGLDANQPVCGMPRAGTWRWIQAECPGEIREMAGSSGKKHCSSSFHQTWWGVLFEIGVWQFGCWTDQLQWSFQTALNRPPPCPIPIGSQNIKHCMHSTCWKKVEYV